MKRNRFHSFWRMTLGLVLIVLAAVTIPFEARASAIRNRQRYERLAVDPSVQGTAEGDQLAAYAGEIRLILEGTFDGRGTFVFEGNTITYRHESDGCPTGLTVNGRPWEDLSMPFRIAITPDFAKAAIVDREGRGTVELTTAPDRFVLLIDDTEASSAPYKIGIAAKNPVPRRQPPVASSSSAARAKEPDEPKEITLQLRGYFFDRDAFVFEGNTITYRNEAGEAAHDVQIDGRQWKDLSTPFKLKYTPDFDKASIIPVEELSPRTTITLTAEKDKFELVLDHAVKGESYYKYVTLAVKDQVDRRLVRSVRGSAPVRMPIVNGGFGPQPMPDFGFPSLDMNGMPKSGRPAFEESNDRSMFPGAAPFRSGAADPAENKEVTLTIEGNFSGFDSFCFKGQSITYRPQELKYQREPPPLPTGVKVDGVPWDDLSKPFGLGYTPDFARAVVLEKVAPYAAGLSRSTTQLQLHFNHPGPPSGYYRFRIAMKDQLRREPEGGFNPFGMFRQPTIDGPTDGLMHPTNPVTRPVIPRHAIDVAVVNVHGTVDRKAGFRLEHGRLIYQNYETDPDRTAPEDPVVLFNGKFASEVTLTDTRRQQKVWTNLSEPYMNPAAAPGRENGPLIDPTLTTHFIFRGDDCDYVYFEHDGVMEVIVTNRTDIPAKFTFIMWNGGDKVFEDNDMQYAPVFGPQKKTDEPAPAPPPPQLSPAPPADATRDITITVEGKLDAKDAFVFEGNTIRFRPSGGVYPDSMSVNALRWNVTDQPFELTFAPDFGKAVVVRSWNSVGGTQGPQVRSSGFTKKSADKDKFELSLGEVVSGPTLPKNVGFNMKVSILKDGIPRSPDAVNPPALVLPPDLKTAGKAPAGLESAGASPGRIPVTSNGSAAVSSAGESTNGMDHPDYTVTEPAPAPVFRPECKIVVKGTVAMNAGFRLQGNRLYYLNYQSHESGLSGNNPIMYDGRFASGVTVNGKPWTNLTRPFELDVNLKPSTGKYLGLKAEHCEYDYQFHHDLFEIGIKNNKREPAPFEIVMYLTE